MLLTLRTSANAVGSRNAAGRYGVVVYAGLDPVTGKLVYLREKIDGTDKAAYKKAKTALGKLLAQVADQRSVNSAVPLGYAIDEWMRKSELEDSTRKTYEGYVERTIRTTPLPGPVRRHTVH